MHRVAASSAVAMIRWMVGDRGGVAANGLPVGLALPAVNSCRSSIPSAYTSVAAVVSPRSICSGAR